MLVITVKTLLAMALVGSSIAVVTHAADDGDDVSKHTIKAGFARMMFADGSAKTEIIHKDLGTFSCVRVFCFFAGQFFISRFAPRSAIFAPCCTGVSHLISVFPPDSRNTTGNGVTDFGYVPFDPRATWRISDNVKIAVKEERLSRFTDQTMFHTVDWMYKAISTWTDESKCAKHVEFDVTVGDSSLPGLMETYYGTGEFNYSLVEADLTSVGFVSPLTLPEYFMPQRFGGKKLLGVCFWHLWEDENGNTTDIDGDGKLDIAAAEIYYNNLYKWSDLDTPPDRFIDFPTLAIHETGHGMGLDHFGMLKKNENKKDEFVGNGKAVMNKQYTGPKRELTGRDKAAYCAAWAHWPRKQKQH